MAMSFGNIGMPMNGGNAGNSNFIDLLRRMMQNNVASAAPSSTSMNGPDPQITRPEIMPASGAVLPTGQAMLGNASPTSPIGGLLSTLRGGPAQANSPMAGLQKALNMPGGFGMLGNIFNQGGGSFGS